MANTHKKSFAVLVGGLLALSCLGLQPRHNPASEALAANEPKSTPALITTRNQIVNVYVNPFATHQTIDGFGGSITWYNNWLTENPNNKEVFNLLFREAGLDILRIKNNYAYAQSGVAKNIVYDLKVINGVNQAAGKKVTVLMSSWSPAAHLKSNQRVEGGGTLKKDTNGKYMYQELGQYFYDAIKVYNAKGVPVDYLSIQNELDFKASYDGCEFDPTETAARAGYDQAFNAVYQKIKELPNAPRLFGPEPMTVDFSVLNKYLKPIIAKDPKQLYGIAHHLYAGGTNENPDTFIKSMHKLRDAYPNLPKWQTEYYRGNAVQTAWTINNTMVEEEANAYLVWDLIWGGTGRIIAMENPDQRSAWKTVKGYTITDCYYSLAHFSKYTNPGDKRLDTSVDPEWRDIKISAYISPEQDRITIVLTNTKYANSKVKLELNGFEVNSSAIYLSNFQPGSKDRLAAHGSLNADRIVNLPAQSVATIVINGKPGKKPAVIKKAAPVIEPVKDEKAEALNGTPQIDGKMDAIWQKATAVIPVNVAHGDHGASAQFRTMWDEDHLYIYAEVTDPNPDDSSKNVYEQDSVEFFVNENNQKPAEYGAGDGQYRVNFKNRQSFGASTANNKLKSAVIKTATGYIVEAAISFQTIKGAVGKTIGFDFQVNDAQCGHRDWILKWSDSSDNTWRSLEDIGRITMVAAKTAGKSK